MRLLALDGPLAKAEPAILCHRLLRTAVRLISHSGYLILRVCRTWPWAIRIRRGFQPRPGHPMTSGPLTQRPRKEQTTTGPVEPGATARRGVAALPGAPKSRLPSLIRLRRGRTRTRVKFRGQVARAS